ncbi:hypothetical protein [Cohnella cholangitidis]|uniref:DUF2157 domain-containing protein n=1 Tax=Cohnella cholangitidis TaxID=2598458 RepID=A0A7G5BTY3_9BACL|nr:hypothetical protein [Cohnella cholangitidis]QMV40417.1 hypothetical protein FPL14_03780 [Cohnella cholangitidis]
MRPLPIWLKVFFFKREEGIDGMAALDEEKRNLIVKEIESWRRSKLLPEQYCDFLQNIYLEDLNERPLSYVGNAVKKIGQASGKYWLLAFGSFALICFIVLHFSVFPLLLQIGITGVVSAAFITFGAKQKADNPVKGLINMGAGMAFLCGVGFLILQLNGWMDGAGPLWLLGICAAVWITSGLVFRYAVVHWFGWMAIVVLYTLLLSRHASGPSLLETQVYWIPAALLFCWLSWFLHVKYKSTGTVLFATSLVLWFMPEVYSALFGVQIEWIQLEIIIKIVIMGVALFRLRKQWMEWVA